MTRFLLSIVRNNGLCSCNGIATKLCKGYGDERFSARGLRMFIIGSRSIVGLYTIPLLGISCRVGLFLRLSDARARGFSNVSGSSASGLGRIASVFKQLAVRYYLNDSSSFCNVVNGGAIAALGGLGYNFALASTTIAHGRATFTMRFGGGTIANGSQDGLFIGVLCG